MAFVPTAAILLPPLPAVVAGTGRAGVLTADGEMLVMAARDASDLLQGETCLVVHAPATFRRLRMAPAACLDLLELFAFACPAQPATPTPRGLAVALDLDAPPPDVLAEAAMLPRIAEAMLARLAAGRQLAANRNAAGLAMRMGEAGWGWAPFVAAALGKPRTAASAEALRVWKGLAEWEEAAPLPPPSSFGVAPNEARTRLASMLGAAAEQRPGQSDYAAAVSAAFAPRERRGDPRVVLAEAGTGTGKTLGYIAPATLWAERNRAPVWISTFTRHLQRQVEGELARLIPDPIQRRRRIVVRKGRENYLCLLNLQDATGVLLGGSSAQLIPLGLIARWAAQTSDGDIVGGDLPGWFAEVFGSGIAASLADRRGECIHAACEHWKKCFVEHTIRRARQADLVVANHALVMAQAVWGGLDDNQLPSRYVFDEGHQIFDAADNAFSAELSGRETAELRRWLLGAEGWKSRARGLKRRIDDLMAGHAELEAPLEAALQAARVLAAPGWAQRLSSGGTADRQGVLQPGEVANPTEALLGAVRTQILARSGGGASLPGRLGEAASGTLECDLHPVGPGVVELASGLARGLRRLAEPLATLSARLLQRVETQAEEMDEPTRNRIEAICRTLKRRATDPLTAWQAILTAATLPQPDPGTRPDHVHFLRLERQEGGDRDVGLHRHWLDPTIPFAVTLARPAQGLLVTSATLRDTIAVPALGGEGDELDNPDARHQDAAEAAWTGAEARAGADHLPSPAIRVAVSSPFDYRTQARAYVVTDVDTRDIGMLSSAYGALFAAAGGGGLGLFTAISRLRAVHARIGGKLEDAGIRLLAQHVDAMDNATLVDVFRGELDSCLLGTDAMRDGVDVPGRALRLVVFERVPWPRPDILHRERRIHLSDGDPGGLDSRVARLRLRQAFGRLIRSAADRGVFVLLDRSTPTRLLSAFPPGVAVQRVGLAEAVAQTRSFLAIEANL